MFPGTALSAFCTDFVTLALYAAVFGFTIGAYVGLTSVILVDLLGLDKLTNAFGLLLLFQGVATLIGPPIAGTYGPAVSPLSTRLSRDVTPARRLDSFTLFNTMQYC